MKIKASELKRIIKEEMIAMKLSEKGAHPDLLKDRPSPKKMPPPPETADAHADGKGKEDRGERPRTGPASSPRRPELDRKKDKDVVAQAGPRDAGPKGDRGAPLPGVPEDEPKKKKDDKKGGKGPPTPSPDDHPEDLDAADQPPPPSDDDEPESEEGGGEEKPGRVSNDLAGKTVQSVTREPKSKILPGAEEIVLTFNEVPDPLRILVTQDGKVAFFYKGLHNLP